LQRLLVEHTTTYRYHRPVRFLPHRLMLRPRDSHDLRLHAARLSVQPSAQLRWMYDVFGNSVAVATIEQESRSLTIRSALEIDRYPLAEHEVAIDPSARGLPFSYARNELPDLGETLKRHCPDPERVVIEWARQWLDASDPRGGTKAFLENLTRGIRDSFRYVERPEIGVQSPIETIRLGSGSCRDFTLLMMESARAFGMAARFVSGYLYDPSLDGQEGEVTGAGFTHAWAQVYLPAAGWIEFDPTNGAYGGRNLIPVSVARTPEQAAPVSGAFTGATEDFDTMEVEVTVRSMQTLDEAAG